MNAAVLLWTTLAVASCLPDGSHAQGIATKSAPGPVRHSVEPLTTRFPALGSPVRASWVSGEMGDGRAPGPSTYWIDAIVELSPEKVADLTTRYRPVPVSTRPDVWSPLGDTLPAGDYLAGAALDAAFTSARVNATVSLAEQEPVVVITAMGR